MIAPSFLNISPKSIIFFGISAFLAIIGIYLLQIQSIYLSLFFFLFSLYFAFLWTLLLSRPWCIVLLPIFVFCTAIVFISSENAFIVSLLFSFGFLFAPLLFFKNYQEKITLSFFRDSFLPLQKGVLFVAMGVSLFAFSVFKEDISFKETTQAFIESPAYSSLVESMSSFSFIYDSLEKSALENISAVCKGEQKCITHLTQEFQSKSEEEKNAEIQNAVDTSLKELITALEKPELVKKINEASSFSLIIFLLVLILPLSRIFSGLFALIFVLLLTLLKKTGIFRIEKNTVEKEYIV
jgi:hypothetical protein